MHLTEEFVVAVPPEQVAALLADPANPQRWHRDLLSATPVSGTPGQPGARTKYVYADKGAKFSVEEELVEVDLPRRVVTSYKGPGMKHRLTISLSPEDGGAATRVAVRNDIELARLAKLAGPVIKKGTEGQMRTRTTDLKKYLETGSID